jgi:hypothetical protein
MRNGDQKSVTMGEDLRQMRIWVEPIPDHWFPALAFKRRRTDSGSGDRKDTIPLFFPAVSDSLSNVAATDNQTRLVHEPACPFDTSGKIFRNLGNPIDSFSSSVGREGFISKVFSE